MRPKARTAREYPRAAQEYAEKNLGRSLLDHTRGCVRTAQKLARRFGLDSERAATASYLHDIAKSFPRDEQAVLARKMGMTAAEIRSYPPAVLHGPLSALIATNELGIDDPEVLQAIEAHSTGCARMCGVARVVFIADYIEPTRSFPGVTELRRRGYTTLDEATTVILKRKLDHLFREGKVVDSRAIDLWNELMRPAK